jgi:hypothetical protein
MSAKVSDEPKASLRDEVREALRAVLASPAASAAAKASAARTLMEFFDDSDAATGRRASEMTADELDEEIKRLTRAE